MGTRLYVGNLSFQTTEDILREAFGADGRSVTEVKIMLERDTGRDAMIEEFTRRMRDLAARTGTNEADTVAYELANPRSMSVDGIARYLRKRRTA